MPATFRKRLLAGEIMVGTLVTLPCPEIVEILAGAGLDWLFIDTEHAVLELKDVQRFCQAAAGKTACLVRCPSASETWIKKALDTGAEGVIIPQVRSAADAELAVRFSKYPPFGQRSMGYARAQGYGFSFSEYVARANGDTALIIQAENIEFLEDMDAILSVDGIDAVFIGPYDLSASMGKIGQVSDPEVTRAVGRIHDACRKARIPSGIFAATAEAARLFIDQGYRLIAVGMDAMMLGSSARRIVEILRK